MTAMDYYKVLEAIHRLLAPRTYVEIGVRHGESWQLVSEGVQSIGIDPAPSIRHEPRGQAQLFCGTSDEFFAQFPPTALFGGKAVDLAFIDGMHLFEYALRDFIHLEKCAGENGVILVHDCLPVDAVTSARERTTSVWSGDVYKLILCLREWRPDLNVTVIDTAPTGLAVITGLKPNDRTLEDNYAAIEQKYCALDYAVLGDAAQKCRMLGVVPDDEPSLRAALASRFGPAKVASDQAAKAAKSVGSLHVRAKLPTHPRKLGVLLCYNDADILVDVLDHLLVNGHDLVVWDHGSTDATPDVLRAYGDALLEHRRIAREVDFYRLYQAMSQHLITSWARRYDWISWPDQDEILEGAHRRASYAEQVHEAYAQGYDWIAFNNVNYWWTAADIGAITSPTRRVRHYSVFPNCAPRIRAWRADKTNVRLFNHNPIAGRGVPVHFNLRHYPMRSQAQMQRRLAHDRAALQRGDMNYHYNNMVRHPERLIIEPGRLHEDDGVGELNLAPRFDWRTIYGHGHGHGHGHGQPTPVVRGDEGTRPGLGRGADAPA